MVKAKNVLFISYDGMTDPLGQSQVIPYLQGLSRAGYSIFLLSCEKKEAFEQNRDNIQQLLDADNIKWIPLNYTKKPPVVSTLLDILKLKKNPYKSLYGFFICLIFCTIFTIKIVILNKMV